MYKHEWLYYTFQVDHPERYGFNPKELLNHLTDIYLHLQGGVLARAIATDERSYRKELFETCTELLRNKNIKSEVHVCGKINRLIIGSPNSENIEVILENIKPIE